MTGIYFIQAKTTGSANLGPMNKIKDEIASFEASGLSTNIVNFPFLETGIRKHFLGKGILASLPFLAVFSYSRHRPEFDGKDFYYIRFEAADRPFRVFLRQLRKNNPRAKIIIEFPDFPNTYWMKSFFYAGIFLKDLCARGSYRKYIDRFAVINNEYKKIYGVETVPYKNGIDVSRIPIKKTSRKEKPGTLTLIAIGSMFAFHGFDRLLRGLRTYYSSVHEKEINLKIVGDDIGGERKKYEQYARHHGLLERVSFYDRKDGAELAALFNESDVAVSSLGMYRANCKTASSLKSREYLARGMPVIAGCPIDVIHGTGFRYCIEFPNDDTEIDMSKIVEWYDSLRASKTTDEISSEIRAFAMNHCDISVVMKPVIEYIKDTSRK